MAAGRGALLLFVAVVLGIFLLNKTDEPQATTVSQRTATTNRTTSTTSTLPVVVPTSIAAHSPREVKVLAANGTNTAGVGARVKDVLLKAEYNALAPIDAKTKPAKTSVVYFTPGYDRDAAAIATLFGLAPTIAQPMPTPATTLVADTRGANVILLAGEDLLPKLPATTTTTTAKAASTTTTAKAASTTTSTTSTTAKP
jgi:hypothetical protein